MRKIYVLIIALITSMSCKETPEESKQRKVLNDIHSEYTEYYIKYMRQEGVINRELICIKNNIPQEQSFEIVKSYLAHKEANINTEETLNNLTKVYSVDRKDLTNFLYDYFITNKAEGLTVFMNDSN